MSEKWYAVSYSVKYQLDGKSKTEHFCIENNDYLPCQNWNISATPEMDAFAFMSKLIKKEFVSDVKMKIFYQNKEP